MKNWKRTFVAGLLCLACLGAVLPTGAVENTYGETIRIGLNYGDSALSSANLMNSVGYGYYMGYTDENGIFCALASTDATEITMLKTQNMYYTQIKQDLLQIVF